MHLKNFILHLFEQVVPKSFVMNTTERRTWDVIQANDPSRCVLCIGSWDSNARRKFCRQNHVTFHCHSAFHAIKDLPMCHHEFTITKLFIWTGGSSYAGKILLKTDELNLYWLRFTRMRKYPFPLLNINYIAASAGRATSSGSRPSVINGPLIEFHLRRRNEQKVDHEDG